MLRTGGVENVQVKIDVHTPVPGEYRRTHLVSLIDSLHDKVIALGLLDEKKEACRSQISTTADLEKPETIVIDKLLVQAWGRSRTDTSAEKWDPQGPYCWRAVRHLSALAKSGIQVIGLKSKNLSPI